MVLKGKAKEVFNIKEQLPTFSKEKSLTLFDERYFSTGMEQLKARKPLIPSRVLWKENKAYLGRDMSVAKMVGSSNEKGGFFKGTIDTTGVGIESPYYEFPGGKKIKIQELKLILNL